MDVAFSAHPRWSQYSAQHTGHACSPRQCLRGGALVAVTKRVFSTALHPGSGSHDLWVPQAAKTEDSGPLTCSPVLGTPTPLFSRTLPREQKLLVTSLLSDASNYKCPAVFYTTSMKARDRASPRSELPGHTEAMTYATFIRDKWQRPIIRDTFRCILDTCWVRPCWGNLFATRCWFGMLCPSTSIPNTMVHVY